jgi:hypothetical protein
MRGECNTPPPPTCFSAKSYENIRPTPIGRHPSLARTANALLLVDMRREPATRFYLSTGGSLRGFSRALNFNEKEDNTNYSLDNACGLAIFFNF